MISARALAPLLPPFLLWALAVPIPEPSRAGGRHLAVIVDTSGSMESNDPPRYTMQLSKILGDLTDDSDELTIVRMSRSGSCSAGVSSSLALRLDPADRSGFKAALAAHTECDTGTNYSAAIRTAIAVLGTDATQQRMLLMLADSGGLGGCSGPLTRELSSFRDSGATVAAINIGMTAGAFDGSPAIDFTTAARNAEEMVDAVALVYQRFLGTKKVRTGEVDGAIEVEVPAYTREAFLVVAADGSVPALEQGLTNPGSRSVDLDYRGGGRSQGRDDRWRAYRIAHLLEPQAGRFTFKVPGLADRAGWMLLLDSAVGVRMISTPTSPRGLATPIEVEVYDQVTGKRITDLTAIPDLDLSLRIDGRDVRLNDEGRDGDRQAGDGVLTGTVTFEAAGRQNIPVHLESDSLERRFTLETEVLEASWSLAVLTPTRAEVDRPVELRLEIRPVGDRSQLEAPEHVDALTGGDSVKLTDDGQGADAAAGDGVYTATWTPAKIGSAHFDYQPRGGRGAGRTSGAVEVVGVLELGTPATVELGSAGSRSELTSRLDLGSATVKGDFEATVSSDFELGRTVLEIDLGEGFVPLGKTPLPLRLAQGRELAWPVRLRVGSCPEGRSPERPFAIRVVGRDAAGRSVETTVALAVEVVADSWFVCWLPVLASAAVCLLATGVVYGYVSPSRFPPRLGVVLAPEEDLEQEGFFHPLRAERAARSGFYRDARIHVTPDFRLSGKADNALARLRAEGKLVRIEPVAGAALWRQNADGGWERLAPGESTARSGVVYKNEMASLFFTVRNG